MGIGTRRWTAALAGALPWAILSTTQTTTAQHEPEPVPSQSSVPERAPETPTHVYADAFTVWIYEEPERSVTPIGMLRAGQRLPLRSHQGRPAHERVARGCGKGWYAVEPAGFVCLDHQLSLEPTRYFSSMAELLPEKGAHPFDFALSMGTTSYRRLPTREEWTRRERIYGPAKPRPLPPHWQGHEELVSDEPLPSGPLPAFLEGGGSVARSPEARLRRREVPFGSMLALTGSFTHEGRRFGQSADGTVVGMDRLRVFRRSSFAGVELDGKRWSLPLAWPRRKLHQLRLAARQECRIPQRSRIPEHSQHAERPDGEPTEAPGTLSTTSLELPLSCLEATSDTWGPRRPLTVSAQRVVIAGTRFLQVTQADDPQLVLLVPEDDVFLAERRGAPRNVAALGADAKWIHFSIARGTLTAYRGDEPLFTTLASPGIGGVPAPGADPLDTRTTPVGTYRIHFKYLTDDMSPEVGEHRSFWIADVPYAMYFQQPFAIHVAYWHESFGEPMSGGCINVSPRDGARLFSFADPPLPEGWYGVGTAPREWGFGTHVVIDRAAPPTPTR